MPKSFRYKLRHRRHYGGVCLLLIAVGLFFWEVTVGGGDARFFERAPTVLLGVW